MGVLSTGNKLGLPDNLVFSFPCRRSNSGSKGDYEIASLTDIDPFTRSLIRLTTEELVSEKREVEILLGPMNLAT